MPSTVYLVTGGARSGKSSYAQSLCESIDKDPIYLATSSWNDDDFKERIEKHQNDRGDHWTTIEEPLTPSTHSDRFSGRTVMIDCLTLWLTNYFVKEGVFTIPEKGEDSKAVTITNNDATERALQSVKDEFDKMIKQWNATFVIVTNEIGSGTHAENQQSRKFVDMQGWLNQHVAKSAYQVIHVVCGIPNVIKGSNLDGRHSNEIPPEEKIYEAHMLDKFLSTRGCEMEAHGYFIMKLDRLKGVIVAQFYSSMKNDKGEVCDLDGKKIPCCSKNTRPEPYKVFEGRTAKELTVDIFEKWDQVNNLIKSLGHVSYIGREAQRAEHCLHSGKHYQQN